MDQRPHETPPQRVRHRDLQKSARFRLLPVHDGMGHFGRIEHAVDMFMAPLGLSRRPNLASRSMEELDTELLFERCDMLADSRLSDAKLPPDRGKGAELHHFRKSGVGFEAVCHTYSIWNIYYHEQAIYA